VLLSPKSGVACVVSTSLLRNAGGRGGGWKGGRTAGRREHEHLRARRRRQGERQNVQVRWGPRRTRLAEVGGTADEEHREKSEPEAHESADQSKRRKEGEGVMSILHCTSLSCSQRCLGKANLRASPTRPKSIISVLATMRHMKGTRVKQNALRERNTKPIATLNHKINEIHSLASKSMLQIR